MPKNNHRIKEKMSFYAKSSFKCSNLVKMKSGGSYRTVVACRKAQMAGTKLSKDRAPCSQFSERPWSQLTKAGQRSQGGEQEAAGGAEINEEAQNEKEQQLENPCGDIRNRAREDNLVITSVLSL